MKHCEACGEAFFWHEPVVLVGEEAYHKDCVILYPTGYVAFTDDVCLGETENGDGQMAYDAFDEGEYID